LETGSLKRRRIKKKILGGKTIMKKTLKLAAAAAIALGLAACSSSTNDTTAADDSSTETVTLKVGATTAPHAEILEEAKSLLADEGVDLEIVEFSDYPNINPSTSDGSLDANYFQHQPYLDSYNEDNGYESGVDGYLVSAGAIHYEPLGLYSKTVTDVADVEDGATVLIPNDATNEARALLLLQDLGLITLSDDATLSTATVADVVENPKNLNLTELAADQIATKLDDADLAIVNGNYALASDITDYLITTEAADSEAAQTYQNVIAVKEENKDNEAVKKLVEVLKSDEIKNFINEKYGVSVVPAA
jgi:D-methionine transport system substrate-binding protein